MGSKAKGSEVEGVAARYIELTGIVQGVGFRPFVYNLAVAHGLRGWVRNTSAGVQVQVEGQSEALDAFVQGLTTQAPPLARIESISVTDRSPNGYKGFTIEESLPQKGAYQLVSPDIATCPACLHELFDPDDRRFGYPFTNCTNCGPRFTIIEDIPYDRPKTTMRAFRMCAQCQAEYEDPANRRFHAQPNACPTCGPHLWLVDGKRAAVATSGAEGRTRGVTPDSDVISETTQLLKQGVIIALKGLGGFHLACDATNQDAVRRLRDRKHRPSKPFAVMVATLDEVERHCLVTAAEAALLTSPSSPIVLLRWRHGSNIARDVAPNNRYLGVMLPYTPVHHLLLREVGTPLVMTSGNLSEEPIAKDNEEALQRLAPLADAFLLHDRGIRARYDDSVWFVPVLDRPQPIRRARGYAPQPVRLGFPMGRVLACGAELKNTFCLTQERYAFVSQHIGDLENLETLEHFEATVDLYQHLFRAAPAAIACDLHPDYLATRYGEKRAQDQGLPLYHVQHHYAHIASCLADNDWSPASGAVIGVALDGTGLGSDGRIWGGEFLIVDYRSFERVGHLQYLPLPGGDAATRNPYRIALAYLYRCLGEIPALPFLASVPPDEVEIVRRMVDRSINTPWTSSCGRLFDAVSALLGVCLRASYEAQAAIELEMIAGDLTHREKRTYPFSIERDSGVYIVHLEPLVAALVKDVQSGEPTSAISAAFHYSVAEVIAQMCDLIRAERGLDIVALSGGCFQNRQLLRLAVEELQAQGFRVLLHRQVPCNDGGISLGQAVVAQFQYAGDSQDAHLHPTNGAGPRNLHRPAEES
jgi:hydrogenase maturation protein HypF